LGRGDSKIPEGSAYLRKSNLRDPEVLNNAIAAVLGKADSQKFRDDVRSSHPLSRISKSQLEILRLVALGHSNQEIAAIRGTTLRAVEGLLKRTIASAGIEISDMAHGRVLAAREFMKAAGLPEQH
jgi:DNA-binding CsgD family transcriptional regulator